MARVGCIPHGTTAIVVQIILYFLAAFFGYFVVIPLGITLRNFHGACILFAEIVPWQKYVIWPWNEPSCLYILYMNLAVNIFYATFMGIVNLLIYSKKCLEKKSILDWNISYILRAFNPVFLVINFFIMFLEISGASVITAGFSDFCNRTETFIMKHPNVLELGLQKDINYNCRSLGKESLFWSKLSVVRGVTHGVRGHSFYGCLVVASIASWILFILWLAQLALNVLMTCRVCSCEVAEEKKKPDKTAIIAQRRSQFATPIATPGGMITPSRGLSLPNPMGAQYKSMTPMGGSYPPPRDNNDPPAYARVPESSMAAGVRPPHSPAESSTPPKKDLSLVDSPSPRQLPPPKQKQIYRKNAPSGGL
ncbi:hypothetical protein HELRODRAFT_170716 [Helobdella robusta]|uniref:Uncharacterized protein n=1 Tax=Helobdella robusta TaxID=6412 RepID=T1F3C6_HELRO|nr:hypothetical protein HELRODRAFT_170716 [Helobdella robusta]ESO07380.1 hypothetical protein HELRODRAFT_170716 [Helobdella robusta]